MVVPFVSITRPLLATPIPIIPFNPTTLTDLSACATCDLTSSSPDCRSVATARFSSGVHSPRLVYNSLRYTSRSSHLVRMKRQMHTEQRTERTHTINKEETRELIIIIRRRRRRRKQGKSKRPLFCDSSNNDNNSDDGDDCACTRACTSIYRSTSSASDIAKPKLDLVYVGGNLALISNKLRTTLQARRGGFKRRRKMGGGGILEHD